MDPAKPLPFRNMVAPIKVIMLPFCATNIGSWSTLSYLAVATSRSEYVKWHEPGSLWSLVGKHRLDSAITVYSTCSNEG